MLGVDCNSTPTRIVCDNISTIVNLQVRDILIDVVPKAGFYYNNHVHRDHSKHGVIATLHERKKNCKHTMANLLVIHPTSGKVGKGRHRFTETPW